MERAIKILEKAVDDIGNLPIFSSLPTEIVSLTKAEYANLDNIVILKTLLEQVLILTKKEHKLWEKTYCKDLEK